MQNTVGFYPINEGWIPSPSTKISNRSIMVITHFGEIHVKRVAAQYPYSEYWLYKVWHEKEGRYQANLILISDTSKRTTMSYARYLMSVKLGRHLHKNEHVDHINNIKSDDSIENLQILSPEENKKKQEEYYKQHNKIMLDLICPCCCKKFQYSARNYRYHTKLGRTNFHCSRSCAVKMQHKNKNTDV